MAKDKTTKLRRELQEAGLVEAIFHGLVATIEAKAKHWAGVAQTLRNGLSATAIKRAERKAHNLADERPPGFVRAMECMEVTHQIARRYKMSKRDQDTFWQAVAEFSMFQLAAKDGPFYDAARHFEIVPSAPRVEIQLGRRGCGNPNCPNCRPRKPEELN